MDSSIVRWPFISNHSRYCYSFRPAIIPILILSRQIFLPHYCAAFESIRENGEENTDGRNFEKEKYRGDYGNLLMKRDNDILLPEERLSQPTTQKQNYSHYAKREQFQAETLVGSRVIKLNTIRGSRKELSRKPQDVGEEGTSDIDSLFDFMFESNSRSDGNGNGKGERRLTAIDEISRDQIGNVSVRKRIMEGDMGRGSIGGNPFGYGLDNDDDDDDTKFKNPNTSEIESDPGTGYGEYDSYANANSETVAESATENTDGMTYGGYASYTGTTSRTGAGTSSISNTGSGYDSYNRYGNYGSSTSTYGTSFSDTWGTAGNNSSPSLKSKLSLPKIEIPLIPTLFLSLLLIVMGMLITAHQMEHRPEGTYANCCRVSLSTIVCAYGVIYNLYHCRLGDIPQVVCATDDDDDDYTEEELERMKLRPGISRALDVEHRKALRKVGIELNKIKVGNMAERNRRKGLANSQTIQR